MVFHPKMTKLYVYKLVKKWIRVFENTVFRACLAIGSVLFLKHKFKLMRYIVLLLFLFSGTAKAQLFQNIGSLPVGGSMVELDFISPTQGYVAVNYYCLKSTNGGYQWTTISSEQFGGAYTYTAMAVADSNHIYLGKNSGGRLRYTKNGSNWNEIQVGGNQGIRSIYFRDTLNGYLLLSGNSGSVDSVRFMKTSDGGDSWGGLITLPEKGYDARVVFTSSQKGIIYYQNKLFYTTDGGASWTAAVGITDGIYKVSMLNDSLGVLGGNSGYIAYTTNGAAQWTTIPYNSTQHVWDVKLMSPSEVYAITMGGNTSYLRHSSDSGKSWVELANGSNTIRRMEFYGTADAWFFGLNNNIYKAPLASSVVYTADFNGQLYPNPFLSSFFLETDEAVQQLQLLDGQGKQVLYRNQLAAGRHELNTDHLPKGIYFVRIQTKSSWSLQKMVKY